MILKKIGLTLAVIAIGSSTTLAKKKNNPKMSNNSDRGTPTIAHRFIKGGWQSGGVGIYNKKLVREWSEKRWDEISDVWQLRDGGVVHSFSRRKQKEAGIRRYKADKTLKWVYMCDKGRDNHSSQPLPGGRFLAGESAAGAAYMVEIDDTGKKVKEVELELPERIKKRSLKDIHHIFRNVRKTPEGTYLAACMSYKRAVEWDAQGKFIGDFKGCHYAAIRLPNGNTLVSDVKQVLEYNDNGTVVWSMKAEDFARLDLTISMLCGLQRLPNGNTVIGSVSHGHWTKGKDFYKVIEVTPKKELVWWIEDPQFKGSNIGSIQVLDVKGDPATFEVYK